MLILGKRFSLDIGKGTRALRTNRDVFIPNNFVRNNSPRSYVCRYIIFRVRSFLDRSIRYHRTCTGTLRTKLVHRVYCAHRGGRNRVVSGVFRYVRGRDCNCAFAAAKLL